MKRIVSAALVSTSMVMSAATGIAQDLPPGVSLEDLVAQYGNQIEVGPSGNPDYPFEVAFENGLGTAFCSGAGFPANCVAGNPPPPPPPGGPETAGLNFGGLGGGVVTGAVVGGVAGLLLLFGGEGPSGTTGTQ